MPNDPPANKQHSVPFKKKVIYQQYQMINNTEELQRLLPTMEGGSGPLKNRMFQKKNRRSSTGGKNTTKHFKDRKIKPTELIKMWKILKRKIYITYMKNKPFMKNKELGIVKCRT